MSHNNEDHHPPPVDLDQLYPQQQVTDDPWASQQALDQVAECDPDQEVQGQNKVRRRRRRYKRVLVQQDSTQLRLIQLYSAEQIPKQMKWVPIKPKRKPIKAHQIVVEAT